ncbi:hypothetical protein [Nocardioides sp. KR10-350]|uniref:hypothetical protein n=1 Tax=Nocardioides cheoyonin TaxID=3156615 RepID=UPI0032B5170A
MKPAAAVVLLVVLALLVTGCGGHDSHRSVCERVDGPEHDNGPVEWDGHSFGFDWTWRMQGRRDSSSFPIQTSAPVILDDVTVIPPKDTVHLSTIKLDASFISDTEIGMGVRPGNDPGLEPLACARVEKNTEDTAPVLVVRISRTPKTEQHGRLWSANGGLALHYRTLDGTPYVAWFAFQIVWGNTRHSGSNYGKYVNG